MTICKCAVKLCVFNYPTDAFELDVVDDEFVIIQLCSIIKKFM